MNNRNLLTGIVIFIGILVFGMFYVSAETGTYGDLTYEISDGEVTITDCKESAIMVEIPSEIGDYPVTCIGDSAFYECTSLISITIPKSITYIGNNAFYDCIRLQSVYINDIAAWCNIDFDMGRWPDANPLYYAENLYINNEYITELVIPDGVSEIKGAAFYNYVGLTSVTIPDSVTSIGGNAFYGCAGLTNISIPDSVTSIGGGAFYNCTGLTNISIPDSVTTIGGGAFDGTGYYNNPSNWENDALYIGKYLIEVKSTVAGNYNIKNGTQIIGDNAFSNCTDLTNISIPDSVTSIGGYAFAFCEGLTSITIPDSVTTIGIFAFMFCDNLKGVYITDISAWCNIMFSTEDSNPLYYAKKLYVNNNLFTTLVVPNGTTEIKSYVFCNCAALTSIDIPDSVTSIGEGAFSGCAGLTNISIPDSVTTIGGGAFAGTGYYNNPSNWEKDVLYIGNHLIKVNTTKNGECYIKNGIRTVAKEAFYECDNIVTVVIPDSITNIGEYAFDGCSKLETVLYEGSESQWLNVTKFFENDDLNNAKFIYNATKKTYKFETNCDESLMDVTDYAIFTMPTVENGGATLTGWYDNEALSGAPVTFPYYGDATTLYAAWTDRTGTNFEDAFIAKANQEYTVTTSGQFVYFEFVPNHSKKYVFYSKGGLDTCGRLYDNNQFQLAYNDDDGEGNNFYISYELSAGNTYYIAVQCYGGTGTFSLVTEEAADYRINSITINDMLGKELATIPMGTFLATISFTNVGSSTGTVIVLAKYTDDGAFKGLMYIQAEDVPTGSTINLSIPVDNTNGDVSKLKAFCWASFSSLTPIGNSVAFPND